METFKKRARRLVAQMTAAEKMEQLRYNAPAIERLGVPAYCWWNECLHGVARAGAATVFPQAIAMAATFNVERMEEVAAAIADEARAKYNEYRAFGETEIYQGLTYWSPNINIFRDPRWGRGQETYGECPYLTGRMGAAFIRGLQGEGDGIPYHKLDATVKHFAVHSGPESERHSFNAVVNEEDLRDTYLWAFRYCIENAHPAAVMGAYNCINGEPACASKTYLQDLLRGEWGFDGYVVSDCGAICDLHQSHHITHNAAESAALAINNGCDLNCGNTYVSMMAACVQGLVSEDTITASAERLFEARFRLGMFDEDCPYDRIPYDVVECDRHTALNRKMAQESIVLLKNTGILPLSNDLSIAVIGPNAEDKSVLLGNYHGTPSHYTTLLQGIQERASRVRYAEGCHRYRREGEDAWAQVYLHEAVAAAEKSDVVILCMGLSPDMEGEEGDAYNGAVGGDRSTIDLPEPQKQLLRAIRETGKPIVFVNVSGGCVNLCEADQSAQAVLQVFYPGAEGGHALADILFGDVSPSGRLPVTFYRSDADLPPFEDYSMKNRTYRYFTGDVLYPFGYGLSYTSFEENWRDACTVEVTNAGRMDGYYTLLHFRQEPHPQLVEFQKVFLRRGEKRVLVLRNSGSPGNAG